jgi:hypothetical protein
MSFIEEIRRAHTRLAQQRADPLRSQVETVVQGMDTISTNALLQLIGLPKTSGNGRRIAKVMRAMGFIPLKSRRLAPGGFRDTVTRGWARPLRASKYQSTATLGETVESFQINNPPPLIIPVSL